MMPNIDGMGSGGPRKPPKDMMRLLATLMLNKKLRQRSEPNGMMRPGNGYGRGQNRMSELARMQLGLRNKPRKRMPSGNAYGLRRRMSLPPGGMPPGLANRTEMPPGLVGNNNPPYM